MALPAVGTIVHYRPYGSPSGELGIKCRCAVVTETLDDDVYLCVINPSGLFFNPAKQDESLTIGGTWHWPDHNRG